MTNSEGTFINKVVQGIEPKQAYKEAFDTNNARGTKDLLKQPDVRAELAKQGITIRRLNKTLKQQLEAKKAIVVSKDSVIEYVPDNQAIDQALTKGYKLYGVLKEKDVIIDNRSITFNGNLDQLGRVIAEMKELNKDMALDTDGEVV
jgi:hypothetical protein